MAQLVHVPIGRAGAVLTLARTTMSGPSSTGERSGAVVIPQCVGGASGPTDAISVTTIPSTAYSGVAAAPARLQHHGGHGGIAKVLQRLRENDTIRVVVALVVVKDENGKAKAMQTSLLTDDEAAEFGAVVGGLIGLGIGGEEGMEEGAEAGAEAAEGGLQVFSDEDAWDVIGEIPNGTASALILLEHRWAIPLREAVVQAGGFPISDGFIHAQDLVEIGLMAADEAKPVEALEARHS